MSLRTLALAVWLFALPLTAYDAASADPAPGMPRYQMREPLPAGDRLAPAASGAVAFSHHCGYCHLAGGMGTNVLQAQRSAAGLNPVAALLTERTDLSANYVRWVVRNGKGAMPAQTRVDITDAELAAVASFLQASMIEEPAP